MCYEAVLKTALPYLSELSPVHSIPFWHSLCSAELQISDPILEKLPKTKKIIPIWAVAWNKLPISICYAATKSQFEPKLKTALFFSAHDGPNS